MFYYLKGKVTLKDETFLVIDMGGVGFKVYTSKNTLSKTNLDSITTVFTYTHVREDAFDIFGFSQKEELEFFQKLISVSGVGPRLALAILSTLSPNELVMCIIGGDSKKIAKTPGVGPKLAQRMILELKDKIDDSVATSAIFDTKQPEVSENAEATGALVALGYSMDEAERAVTSVERGLSLEDTIKKALLYLMR